MKTELIPGSINFFLVSAWSNAQFLWAVSSLFHPKSTEIAVRMSQHQQLQLEQFLYLSYTELNITGFLILVCFLSVLSG